VSRALLGILYPHYLAPVPSMAIAQFHLDSGQGSLTNGYRIPRHTELTTKPVRGVRCRFRTCSPVTLWPLEIASAELHHPLRGLVPLPGSRSFRSHCVLVLRLRAFPGASFASLAPGPLRIFLHGEGGVMGGVYEILCAGPCQVELHDPAGAGRGGLVLAPGAIHPGGFDREDMALPYPPHSFRGYALLQEYFSFPEKFLCFDLLGLQRAGETGATQEIEVRIFSARIPHFDQAVQPSNFRLGCTPVANLFQRRAEPIRMDHTKVEYRVVPDAHAPWAHEVYSIDSVTCVGGDGFDETPLQPLYALGHRASDDGAFWSASRRQAIDGATEVHLSTTDEHLAPTTPAVETLSLALTCTNRDLPARLPFSGGIGGDLDTEHIAPFVRVECLSRPSAAARPVLSAGAHWRLISQLSLNHLSLVEGGVEALRGILELYDFADSAATRNQIAGLAGVGSQRVVRNVNGAFCQGLRVHLSFEREHFVGAGFFLFASVLERFLALYASINSFIETEAHIVGEETSVHRWPPRAGDQPIL